MHVVGLGEDVDDSIAPLVVVATPRALERLQAVSYNVQVVELTNRNKEMLTSSPSLRRAWRILALRGAGMGLSCHLVSWSIMRFPEERATVTPWVMTESRTGLAVGRERRASNFERMRRVGAQVEMVMLLLRRKVAREERLMSSLRERESVWNWVVNSHEGVGEAKAAGLVPDTRKEDPGGGIELLVVVGEELHEETAVPKDVAGVDTTHAAIALADEENTGDRDNGLEDGGTVGHHPLDQVISVVIVGPIAELDNRLVTHNRHEEFWRCGHDGRKEGSPLATGCVQVGGETGVVRECDGGVVVDGEGDGGE